MAAPSFLVAGAMSAATSGTTATAAYGAGVLPWDVSVVGFNHNAASTFTAPGPDWPLLGTASNDAAQSTAWFWHRHATANDAAPVTTISGALSTTVGVYGRIYTFRGVRKWGIPFDAQGAVYAVHAVSTAGDTTPQQAEIQIFGEDRYCATLVYLDDDNTWSSGFPPGFHQTLGGIASTATGGDCSSDGCAIPLHRSTNPVWAARTVGTQSAVDPWRTITFALIPDTPPPWRSRPYQMTR